MVNVAIIYPTDPFGVVPGGIDTCIRDILRFAPQDVRMRLIGVTTDTAQRPLRRWSRCQLAGNDFDFYPVLAIGELRRQLRIPLSARFTLALVGNDAWKGADILQFHRLEPAVLYHRTALPKVGIIHHDLDVIEHKGSDIRWRHLPGAYSRLEQYLLPNFDEILIVKREAVRSYQARFPQKQQRISFLPTWMNSETFFVPQDEERALVRQKLCRANNWPIDSILMISVGRLDRAKDPLLAIRALGALVKTYPKLRYLLIGDGVLRDEIESAIESEGLRQAVALLGAMSQRDLAPILRSSDLLLLTSHYEGMPRCVIEALGCGLPVASTDVGEVRLVVRPGRNGSIATAHTMQAVVDAVSDCVDNLARYRGTPCTDAVRNFTATAILERLYDTYRQLAGSRR